MVGIVVRRHEANQERTSHDHPIDEVNSEQIKRDLWAVLWNAHCQRGVGVWDNSDPEVWVDDRCIGRLSLGAEIGEIVRLVIAQRPRVT
jgi:hypothetical protein